MRNWLTVLAILFLGIWLFTASSVFADGSSDASAECKKILQEMPNLRVSKMFPGPVRGSCELWAGSNVIYYFPKEDLLFFGEVWTTTGKSLTQESRNRMIAERLKDVDLSKALKWGSGPVRMILFVDPDCPFCKRVEKMLFTKLFVNDITAYIFLYPLPIHPKARTHALDILCSDDPVGRLLQYASGSADVDRVSEECRKKAVGRLSDMMSVGRSLGVSGTPFMVVEDTVISGADLPRLFETIARYRAKANTGSALRNEGR